MTASTIASSFADFFATVSNAEKEHTKATQNLSSGFNIFTDYQVGSNTFDIETVSNVILDSKKGKASGLNNLALAQSPILSSECLLLFILTFLFKSFPGILGFVLDNFGCGSVIPIPKLIIINT